MFRYSDWATLSAFGVALAEFGDEQTAISLFVLCIWWERWIEMGPLALRAILILSCLNCNNEVVASATRLSYTRDVAVD